MKKRKILILLSFIIFILILGTGCFIKGESQSEIKKTESEVYEMEYIEKLNKLGVTINMNEIYEDYLDNQWYLDRMELPDKKTIVSLHVLKKKIHVYKLIENKDIVLTYEDVINLYSMDFSKANRDKTDEFNNFFNWWRDSVSGQSGSAKYSWYIDGMKVGAEIYEKQNGGRFKGKDMQKLTTEEYFQLEDWVKENPDYDLAKEDYNYNFLLKILDVDDVPDASAANNRVYTMS